MGAQEKLKAYLAAKAEANLKTAEKFFQNNGSKNGVITLPSGLQYQVITMGTGDKPSATHTVICHYTGTNMAGAVFDSSVQRGKPASFALDRVIKGWTEAIQLMPKGSIWKLFIPAHLAYGERAVNALIGPNSALIFEVELIDFH